MTNIQISLMFSKQNVLVSRAVHRGPSCTELIQQSKMYWLSQLWLLDKKIKK